MSVKGKKTYLFDTINTLILICVAIICIIPFFYVFFISISDGMYLSRGEVTFFPKGANIEAYKEVLTNPRFYIGTGFRNSIVYTLLGTIIAVIFTYLTAYVLTRPRIKFRYGIMALFVITWVFEAGIIPQYIAYSSLGFIDNIWVMIIPGAINTHYLIITKAYLEGVPKELEEAAIVDGANDFTIVYKIFVPVTKPIIATIALFNAVSIWNQYLIPQMFLHENSMKTIQQVLANVIVGAAESPFANVMVNNVWLNQENMKAAAIILAMLPIIVVYPFVQKYFKNGILIGSVKG